MNRIADYALIGDCHSLALIGWDGAIDWACLPRFDSPSQFCRALDADRGGHFSIRPSSSADHDRVTRAYVEDTNVLVTTFRTSTGELELTDCMPVHQADPGDPAGVRADHAILRRARCTGGQVEVSVEISPRFEYATLVPRFRLLSPTDGEIVGGADALWIASTHPLVGSGERFSGRWTLRAAQEAWVAAAWHPSHEPVAAGSAASVADFPARLAATIRFWQEWMSRCAYRGEHSAAVRRSALVLKALTYAPSGAVIAAGTTSFPEALAGGRNWDYRYTWIRDATLTLISLFILGFTEEAAAFKWWLERSGAGRPEDLQIMYGICGERRLPELELSHLVGHRGSAPVRVGNGAATQTQLDSYGQILQAAYLYRRAGGELTEDNWRFLSGVADLAALHWRKPDHGIWEMRDDPRHFVHSKACCWLALDRALRLASEGRPAPIARWAAERDAIREYLLQEAAPHGWFCQAVGANAVDASTLILPAIGFLPTTHPLVLETIEVVRRDLEQDGLVFRYLSPDGLSGDEGTFLLCSFWLLDCLTHANRLDEADGLMERLLRLANDVGLYAEEVDPGTGDALGNLPQAFPHMALVASCSHLAAAKRGEVPFDGAHDYAELALDRLLASRGRLDAPAFVRNRPSGPRRGPSRAVRKVTRDKTARRGEATP